MWWFLLISYLLIATLFAWWAKTVDLPFRSYIPLENWIDAIGVGLVWPLYFIYFGMLWIILLIRILFGIDPDDD